MKNLLALLMLGALAWYGYGKYKAERTPEAPVAVADSAATAFASPSAVPATTQFSCDGRTHCSQMRSCAEATYFVQHCPNTEMDGNNDGVPCERQWCK